MQRKEVLKIVQQKHRLALNPAAHRGTKGLHSKTHLQKRYRGYRAPGAGRKDVFPASLASRSGLRNEGATDILSKTASA